MRAVTPRLCRQLAVAALLTSVWGCSSPFAPLDHVDGCSATTLGPLAGTVPQVTWSGGCKVAVLLVEPVASDGAVGTPVWHVWGAADAGGGPNNLIQSGVRYGETPRFARVVVPPTALVRGQLYRVELRVTSIATRITGATVGQADFTP